MVDFFVGRLLEGKRLLETIRYTPTQSEYLQDNSDFLTYNVKVWQMWYFEVKTPALFKVSAFASILAQYGWVR